MSYTIEDLFTRACSLIDALKTDGTVDVSATNDYRARTLTLVDIAIKKLGVSNSFNKIYEFDMTDELGKVEKVQMPTDLKDIVSVLLTTDEAFEPIASYQIEQEGLRKSIYIPFYTDAKVRVQYRPFSTVPTSFADILEIDDTSAIAICYDLAMNYVATEQNDRLTNLFRSQFEQLKDEARKNQPKGFAKITNVYGTF